MFLHCHLATTSELMTVPAIWFLFFLLLWKINFKSTGIGVTVSSSFSRLGFPSQIIRPLMLIPGSDLRDQRGFPRKSRLLRKTCRASGRSLKYARLIESRTVCSRQWNAAGRLLAVNRTVIASTQSSKWHTQSRVKRCLSGIGWRFVRSRGGQFLPASVASGLQWFRNRNLDFSPKCHSEDVLYAGG